MSGLKIEAPIKVMIGNLSCFTKSNNNWTYRPDENSLSSVVINKIHIQGEVNKTAGFVNEILILNDGTGKAKVTRGPQVPGDFSWLKAGVYCSVVGTLIVSGKLPHIAAIKIANITNETLKEMWPLEVAELKDVLMNKISSLPNEHRFAYTDKHFKL